MNSALGGFPALAPIEEIPGRSPRVGFKLVARSPNLRCLVGRPLQFAVQDGRRTNATTQSSADLSGAVDRR